MPRQYNIFTAAFLYLRGSLERGQVMHFFRRPKINRNVQIFQTKKNKKKEK